MTGIEDLLDDAEKDEVDKLADELGIEDKEQLNKVDSKISDLYKLLVSFDKKMEELEDRITMIENALTNEAEESKTDDKDDSGLEF